MAKRSSADVAFFLLDGLSLLGYSSDLSDGREAITEDVMPLGQAWPQPLPTGAKRAEFSQAGWYDDTVNGYHTALNEQQATLRVLTYGFSGNTIGQPFSGAAGVYAQQYGRVATRNALHKATAKYAITGVAEDGVILHALGAETADGNTEGATSVDRNGETTVPTVAIATSSVANPTVITTSTPHGLVSGDKVMIAGHSGSTPAVNGEQTATVTGATTFTVPINVTVGGTGGTVKRLSTQEGGAAYLACSALTLAGYTNLTVKVRHSQDDATYVDLVAMTARTGTGAERKTVAGTVYRHLAAAWAWTGAGAAKTGTFMLGFARG